MIVILLQLIPSGTFSKYSTFDAENNDSLLCKAPIQRSSTALIQMSSGIPLVNYFKKWNNFDKKSFFAAYISHTR